MTKPLQIKTIHDEAVSQAAYYKRHREEGRDWYKVAWQLGLRALRRLGELHERKAGRPKNTTHPVVFSWKDVGLAGRKETTAVTLAAISLDDFEIALAQSLSPTAAVQWCKRSIDAHNLDGKVGPLVDVGTGFRTIVADPPWDWGDEGDNSQMGRGRPDYATMSIEAIAALPVADVSAADAHLYLWITNRSLPKGFGLILAWGFRYVTCITWAKPSIGMGNYFRGQTEHLLFAIRGSLKLKRKDASTLFRASRGEKHSAKPAAAYELIESCSPKRYLEMFGRDDRKGWKQWP